MLRQGDSRVINGNLLTLPVGGGLLYVQPVYIQSQAGRRRTRCCNACWSRSVRRSGSPTTLDEALDQVFGGDSGATTGDAGAGREATRATGTEPPTLDAQAAARAGPRGGAAGDPGRRGRAGGAATSPPTARPSSN